jgi:type II secretory pathway pseudopilin PulG
VSNALKAASSTPMAYGMLTRARQRPAPGGPAEDGFILIEVLVSALILAIVAGAVLALITATTHSAATERAHSVAYGLAQEDQARLRTMRLASLNEKNELRPNVMVGGQTYEVRSRGRFVNNSSGTRTCSPENASADYVEITSTVSSSAMRNPISLHSIISPTSGSLDPSHGSLAVQAQNSIAGPVSGIVATISGPTNATASTGEEGCAMFADIPAGTYRVTVEGKGLVNRKGQLSETLPSVGVTAGSTAQVPVYFDKPSSITPSFVYVEPGKAPLQTAAIDSMMVSNTESGELAKGYGSPGTYPPTSALEVPTAYPFAAPYSVYAGSCVKDQPVAPSLAVPSFTVLPGKPAHPQVQVPALSLEAQFENKAVKEAKVVITDTSCPETGTKVKRIFFTDKIGKAAVDKTGEAKALGLPYGVYEICVSALLGGVFRRGELKGLAVQDPTTPTVKSVTLAGTSTTKECS